MNYLAHLYLAEDHAASRIGNLLGDFVTGPLEEIRLPPSVVAGIARHRAIDRFTDEHPAVTRARGLFKPPRRRFANAILDICFDHLLARTWPHERPLREFLDRFYDELRTHRSWLPPELAIDLDERIAADWLNHYDTEDGLQGVFDRLARRRPACAAISTALVDYRAHRKEIAETFESLLRDLRPWLAEQGPEL